MPNRPYVQPLPEWVTWVCCDHVHDDGTPCTGAAQSDYGRCLTHLDDTQLASVMTPRPDAAPPDLDARGVRLAWGDFERVLAAARSEDGLLRLGGVSLGGATVQGRVFLVGAVEDNVSELSLDGATVTRRVSLREATVEGNVSLDGATVEGDVFVGGATVKGRVSLDGATVKGLVFLGEATVKGGVSLDGATVEGEALLGPMSITMLSLAGRNSPD